MVRGFASRHKLEFAPNPSQEQVEVFVQAFKAFCSDNYVDLIIINARNTKGDYAGGAATFRIEGIMLASSPVPIIQVHRATITATNRKQSNLKNLRPTAADLGKAYDLAFEGLK